LADYATRRNMSIVLFYHADRFRVDDDEDLAAFFIEGDKLQLPGRLLRRIRPVSGEASVEVSGCWRVVGPGSLLPRDECPPLVWPGVADDQPVADLPFPGSDVLVSDAVLGLYEGRPDFEIHPETGGVWYGGQWSITGTKRVGRDLILVDLYNLYRTAPPHAVEDWNGYARPLPESDWDTLREAPNVATRARALTFGVARIGSGLAWLLGRGLNQPIDGAAIVGFDEDQLTRE